MVRHHLFERVLIPLARGGASAHGRQLCDLKPGSCSLVAADTFVIPCATEGCSDVSRAKASGAFFRSVTATGSVLASNHWEFSDLTPISGPNNWRGCCGCTPVVRCVHCRPEAADEDSSGYQTSSWFQRALRARRAATAQGSWGRVGVACICRARCMSLLGVSRKSSSVEDVISGQINFILALNFGIGLHDCRLELASIIKERLVIRFGRPAVVAQTHKNAGAEAVLGEEDASLAEAAGDARTAEWRLAQRSGDRVVSS